MSATKKQIELCTALIDNGASYELKCPHEDSIEAADAFIKKNYHYLQNGKVMLSGYEPHLPADEYNIPNH